MNQGGRFISILILAALAISVAGAIPETMNYQGKLTDPGGVAIDDPDRTIAILIYDVHITGTPLWAETLTVDIDKGLFDVTLGEIHPIDLDFSGQLWIALKVDQNDDGDVTDATDEFLMPREPLSASP